MNNPKVVDVGHAGHDLRELYVIEERKVVIREEAASGLTNHKRLTSGLDLVYSIMFPFRIQSEVIRKLGGSVETETPNKGKTFGWDRRFQPMISRQKR